MILGSGTPSLVLPYHGAPFRPFDTVLVAWQPSAASARALAASLPHLRMATAVHLVTWTDDLEAARESQLDVVHRLALHGVGEVERHCGHAPGDVGGALLTLAGDVGADLLVMGCYGRSPARELLLGGSDTLGVARDAPAGVDVALKG